MNYQELVEQATQKLESLRIRKAKLQEQINQVADQLGLDKETPILDQLDALEKANESKKQELDAQLKELELKFKELDGGSTAS